VPSYRIDGSSICRDIDAGLGWDESWLDGCAKSYNVVRWSIACGGLVLMVAQWWALMSVRIWGNGLRNSWRWEMDVEKAAVVRRDDVRHDEKTGC
jgi:hypothetical protein